VDIREFIEARIAERETLTMIRSEWWAREIGLTNEALRDILDLHNNWVIALEGPIKIEPPMAVSELKDMAYPDAIHFTASREIGFVTEQQYRVRFGKEPPTAPMIRTIAKIWRHHPDYQQEWE
jgi:hypothetical protein